MDFKTTRTESGLLIENGSLRLNINHTLAMQPSLTVEGAARSVVTAETPLRPAFHLQLEGHPVTLFQADWESLEIEETNGPMGIGRKVRLKARSGQHGYAFYQGLAVSARVELEFYESFPSVVIGSAEFT